jgi:hypothetical protein
MAFRVNFHPPKKVFTALAENNKNTEIPSSWWDFTFNKQNDKTAV